MRVDADGNIRLPMLKDPIQVRGMVPSQLESAIARALTKGNVLVDPVVTVTIVEYQSRPVNVVGAVKNPLVSAIGGVAGLTDYLLLKRTDLAAGRLTGELIGNVAATGSRPAAGLIIYLGNGKLTAADRPRWIFGISGNYVHGQRHTGAGLPAQWLEQKHANHQQSEVGRQTGVRHNGNSMRATDSSGCWPSADQHFIKR